MEATGVAGVAEGAGRRAAEREESFIANTGVLLNPSSEELNITLHLFPNYGKSGRRMDETINPNSF